MKSSREDRCVHFSGLQAVGKIRWKGVQICEGDEDEPVTTVQFTGEH